MSHATCIIACGSPLFCGSGKNKTRVLHQLGKAGYQVHYVTTATPHLLRQVATPGFASHVVSAPHSDFLGRGGVLNGFAIAERMTQLALCYIDTKHPAPILWGTYLFPFVHAAIMAKQNVANEVGAELPLIASLAGSDIWQIGVDQYYNVRGMLFDRRVDRRVTYSDQFKREIQARFGSDLDIAVVPPLLDSERFGTCAAGRREAIRRRIGVDLDATVLICHSNMRPVKNPRLVVEASEIAASRLKRGHKLYLLLVGPRPAVLDRAHFIRRLRKGEVTETPAGLRVLWTGLRGDVERFLHAADIAVNCSFHDSFNISLLEALACGLPCVTTDVVGIASHIRACDAGLLVTTRMAGRQEDDIANLVRRQDRGFVDVEEIAEALLTLIRDGALRAEMGRRGAAYVHSTFSEEKVLPHYQRLLRGLVAR